MIFVAIAEHTAAQCPGSNPEVKKVVEENMPKIPDLKKKYNVKNLGIYAMMGSHKNLMILDAPSYDAAEMSFWRPASLAGIGWSWPRPEAPRKRWR